MEMDDRRGVEWGGVEGHLRPLLGNLKKKKKKAATAGSHNRKSKRRAKDLRRVQLQQLK